MSPIRRAFVAAIPLWLATAAGGVARADEPWNADADDAGALPSKRERPKTQRGEETVKQGTIAVVRGVRGGEPQLAETGGRRWLLVGPLQAELVRLGGHTVKVWAVVGEKKVTLPTLTVRRYEILDAGGGKKPFVGTLRQTQRKVLQLHQEDETDLTVQAKKPLLKLLRRRIGCKVWLAGELEGDTLRAYKFGWLRCAKQPPLRPQKETNK